MMHVRTKIIEKLLNRDDIQDTKENGIARKAVDIGYENLTDGRAGQKFVLEKYFSPICEGDNINQDCNQKLSDEEHLEALTEVLLYEKISCRNCRNQMDHQKNTMERMQSE